MGTRFNSIFITLATMGAVMFIFVAVAPAEGVHSDSDSARVGMQTTSSQAHSRQPLAGKWKFNREQSDDPARKIVSEGNLGVGEVGGAPPGDVPAGGVGGMAPMGGIAGTGIGGGMGGTGGGMGGGIAGAAQPMPQAAPAHNWETDKDRQKRLESLMPAGSLAIEQKDNELDFVDDRNRKQIFYTDGRKLRKSKDDKLQEFAAHWDAGRLTYDEKRPPHGTITRTFELSPDGRQMYETTEIENGKISVPTVIRYVYDAAPAGANP